MELNATLNTLLKYPEITDSKDQAMLQRIVEAYAEVKRRLEARLDVQVVNWRSGVTEENFESFRKSLPSSSMKPRLLLHNLFACDMRFFIVHNGSAGAYRDIVITKQNIESANQFFAKTRGMLVATKTLSNLPASDLVEVENWIYMDAEVTEKLADAELQKLIAHELGHLCYPNPPKEKSLHKLSLLRYFKAVSDNLESHEVEFSCDRFADLLIPEVNAASTLEKFEENVEKNLLFPHQNVLQRICNAGYEALIPFVKDRYDGNEYRSRTHPHNARRRFASAQNIAIQNHEYRQCIRAFLFGERD